MNKVFVDLEYLCPSVSDKVEAIVRRILKERFNFSVNPESLDEEEYLEYLDMSDNVKELLFNSDDKYYSNILNFNELYSLDNIDVNRATYLFNNYQDFCFVFYYNTFAEMNAKSSLIRNLCGNANILPIPYKLDEKRVNKANFVQKTFKIKSLEDCILLDNSFTSLMEWNQQGGKIDEKSSKEVELISESISFYVKKKQK